MNELFLTIYAVAMLVVVALSVSIIIAWYYACVAKIWRKSNAGLRSENELLKDETKMLRGSLLGERAWKKVLETKIKEKNSTIEIYADRNVELAKEVGRLDERLSRLDRGRGADGKFTAKTATKQ